MARRAVDVTELCAAVRTGDRRAVARAISLVEDRDPKARELVAALYPDTGRASVAGFTGPPGAGKSTLIGAVVTLLREAGARVGVISVDPSSPYTQGALLGDRIRLSEHFLDAGVYIRSMSTRGHLGGVSEASLQALLVLDAAGMGELVLETVGVGQSEIEVASVADTVVLVLMPGSGDSIQALKAGVMEIPDVIAINKADHPNTSAMRADLRSILSLDRGRAWRVPVVETEAVNGRGVAELWQAVTDHRAFLAEQGRLDERRRRSLEHELVSVAAAGARRRLAEAVAENGDLRELLGRVERRELDPLTASAQIAERVLGGG